MARVFMAMFFVIGLWLLAGDVSGKTYYRWVDDGGVVQLSDEPPKSKAYERIVIPDRASEQQTTVPTQEKKTEEPGKAPSEGQQKGNARQAEKVKELEAMVAHYSDVGGITAGKLAALIEAVEVVKKAKMDGSEADEAFYDKIDELVRSIKDRTHIIGRVHRLLNEAKVMKGLAPPPPAGESGG